MKAMVETGETQTEKMEVTKISTQTEPAYTRNYSI